MVVEYLLLLLISIMILGGAFGLSKGGPIEMLQKSSPYLAKQVEDHLETGSGFKPPVGWTPQP